VRALGRRPSEAETVYTRPARPGPRRRRARSSDHVVFRRIVLVAVADTAAPQSKLSAPLDGQPRVGQRNGDGSRGHRLRALRLHALRPRDHPARRGVVVALALLPLVPLAVLFALLQSFLSALGNTTGLSAVERTVPDEFLRRYFATDEALSFGMIPLGIVVSGGLPVILGTVPMFVLSGVGTASSSFVLLASRSVRRWGVHPSSARPA
jgi:hypothetical protein